VLIIVRCWRVLSLLLKADSRISPARKGKGNSPAKEFPTSWVHGFVDFYMTFALHSYLYPAISNPPPRSSSLSQFILVVSNELRGTWTNERQERCHAPAHEQKLRRGTRLFHSPTKASHRWEIRIWRRRGTEQRSYIGCLHPRAQRSSRRCGMPARRLSSCPSHRPPSPLPPSTVASQQPWATAA